MNMLKINHNFRLGFVAIAVSLGLLLFSPNSLSAQACDCSRIFDELVEAVEEHYIGYHLEIDNSPRRKAFESHISASRTNVRDIEAIGAECTRALQHFLDFFEDGHLFVYKNSDYSKEALSAFKFQHERNKITDPLEFEQVPEDSRSDPSGRWTDGASKYLIIPRKDEFLAYTVESKDSGNGVGSLRLRARVVDGEVEGLYYSESGVPRYVSGGIYKEGTILRLTGGMVWVRMESEFKQEVASHNFHNPHMPVITSLDDETVLFTIPSFLVDTNDFIQYLIAHKDALYEARYLIIDVRGNTGGNALYTAFMDLFADRTAEGSQGLVLASEATLAYFGGLAERNPELYQPVVDEIQENIGSIVDGPFYPGKTYDPIPVRMELVGILADRGSMSAAESFILAARKYSSKVITFGEPTGGVIDYTSVHMIPVGCPAEGMLFGFPTSTLNKVIPKNGYNHSGIIPDVSLDGSVHNKVMYIQRYLKELKQQDPEWQLSILSIVFITS